MLNAPGRTNYQRVSTSQQYPQALFLHRSVEAANDRDISVPQVSSQVISLQDKVSGAADGAEEGGELALAQDASIAPGG